MINFIERKTIDHGRMESLLAPSLATGHWANFGPASQRLEREIAALLELPKGRSVVACSSGTAALFAAAGLAEWRSGRGLRWIVSAFGFLASAIGPLAPNVVVVDCDRTGMLPLDEIARRPLEDWDGLIVTNLFGSHADPREYRTFCAQRGKYLLVDNATCLLGFDRSDAAAADEILSFHHTKPWGFGEGGCVILDAVDAPKLRALLNTGHGAPERLHRYAANGKMSDLSAAAILTRLESLEDWAPAYRTQHRRISSLAATVGWSLLCAPVAGNIPAFVPLVGDTPVPTDRLADCPIPLGRYYPPIRALPSATDLHRRIVCVPCHPGIGDIADAAILDTLNMLAETAGDVDRAVP